MLEHLDVCNLALSTNTHVDFKQGMHCITGETGAGKSLVVDALSLVLGARADTTFIRDGKDKCEVCAIFNIDGNDKLQDLIKENCLTNDDDATTLILRRVISSDGKSKAFVNSHPSTLTILKNIANFIVSIHGQHASVKLIDEQNQLALLDSFAGLNDEVIELNKAFALYNAKRRDLINMATLQKDEASVYKSLRFELDELTKLDLSEGSYEALEKSFDNIVHQEHLNDATTLALASLSNDESNVYDILSARLFDLQKVEAFDKERISPIIENFNNAMSYLNDVKEGLSDIVSNSYMQSSIEIEQKMSKCHELSRRFGVDPASLYLQKEKLEKRIANFLDLKSKIEAQTALVKDLRDSYEKKAKVISDKRIKAASLMSDAVTDKIHSLAIPDGIFKVNVTFDNECKPRSNGRDNVSFIFSANKGQDLRPLGVVASGGELSRLALAIEVLTSSKSNQTLIFDEVDTGISGRTASSVGELLKSLGQKLQVITITHLPQVAAKADVQYLVSKENTKDGVQSHIVELDTNGRIQELARMMGGNVVTQDTLNSAKSLLEA